MKFHDDNQNNPQYVRINDKLIESWLPSPMALQQGNPPCPNLPTGLYQYATMTDTLKRGSPQSSYKPN